jgi:formiminotetrahydrofolate cyclodeaminase
VLERLVGASNTWLRSDLAIAAILAGAAVRAARWNVSINLPTLIDAGVSKEHADDLMGAATDMLANAEQRAHAIEDACRAGW